MVSPTRRALFSATIFLAACGFAGSLLGGRVAAQSASDESALRDSMKSFTDVYGLVEANYANKLNSDQIDKSIYDGAIPGMLHVLDPHSNFYDPKAYAAMREEQRGHYYGVGMHIQMQPPDNKIVVIAPTEGSPAFKAGIKPADVIVAIDGKPTTGLDTLGVANLLKGPRGTKVSVSMQRDGVAKPIIFELVRDEIAQPSVDIAFLIKPGIGYVHITGEMETTASELQAALDRFGPNLNGLLIDLRGNPGGLLNEAVDVCDKFAPSPTRSTAHPPALPSSTRSSSS
jgi:carboxyl-terminal processing protease